MSQQELLVNVKKLARQQAERHHQISPSLLPRLQSSVHSMPNDVNATLEFIYDEQRRINITGEIKAQVEVTCQRCLQLMTVELSASPHLAVVQSDEQAQNLPKSLDPWLVIDDVGDLASLVEEELLLVLPYINYHDVEQCSGLDRYESAPAEEEVQTVTKQNPFQVLEQLKKGT